MINISVFLTGLPNPCYNITYNLERSDHLINITLIPIKEGDICVQCIGELGIKIILYNVDIKKTSVNVYVKNPINNNIEKVIEYP